MSVAVQDSATCTVMIFDMTKQHNMLSLPYSLQLKAVEVELHKALLSNKGKLIACLSVTQGKS